MSTVRIIGIDPGSRITGYGVIDFDGQQARHVTSGHVVAGDDGIPARLGRIFEGLIAIVDEIRPAELAIEKVFVHRNVASALKLGQARGAALLAGVTRSLEIHEYSPNEVKLAVVGRGHAKKEQIQHMVRALLSLQYAPQADEADALAVAICHGHTRQTLARHRQALLAAGARR